MSLPTPLSIPGLTVTIDERAVRVSSERDLAVLSSAVVGGGFRRLREIVNMHVDDAYDGSNPRDDLTVFATHLGIDEPFAGLMTAAYTQYATVASESAAGVTVAAIVSVGLSNTTRAGVTPPIQSREPVPGTINAILVMDADLTASAMVNAVITATEAKSMTLAEWDVKTPEGEPATGTSTDTVVVACTGRGETQHYAGPATTVGWLTARTVRAAMTTICREKLERDGGRRIGW